MAGHAKRGSCRIIAGKWRGRTIKFNDAEGLRPTTDRIRETVFNWLQPYTAQSICLDMFAGTGVLGFEALSRGADEVVFVESNQVTVKSLNENIKLLAASNAKVHHQDALSWLSPAQSEPAPEQSQKRRFNLVFLDPPFHTDLLEKSCALLNSSGVLAEDAIIYVEHAADAEVSMPASWLCLKEKNSGQVSYKLFENSIVV